MSSSTKSSVFEINIFGNELQICARSDRNVQNARMICPFELIHEARSHLGNRISIFELTNPFLTKIILTRQLVMYSHVFFVVSNDKIWVDIFKNPIFFLRKFLGKWGFQNSANIKSYNFNYFYFLNIPHLWW